MYALNYKQSSLFSACYRGDQTYARQLLLGDSFFEDYNKTLIIACKQNYVDIVHLLLTKCDNINIQNFSIDPSFGTPLVIACKNNNIDIVKLLLDKGAETKISDINKNTPLLIACEMNHVEIVKLLLDKGANKDHTNNLNQTALDIATEHNNTEIIALLNSV